MARVTQTSFFRDNRIVKPGENEAEKQTVKAVEPVVQKPAESVKKPASAGVHEAGAKPQVGARINVVHSPGNTSTVPAQRTVQKPVQQAVRSAPQPVRPAAPANGSAVPQAARPAATVRNAVPKPAAPRPAVQPAPSGIPTPRPAAQTTVPKTAAQTVRTADPTQTVVTEPAAAARNVTPKPVSGQQTAAAKPATKNEYIMTTVSASKKLKARINSMVGELNRIGQGADAAQISSVYSDAVREKFSVAVVGEFSRGKSTLLNDILGRDVLCTGIRPTTAMITRIRAGQAENITIYDGDGNKRNVLPISKESWDSYTASKKVDGDMDGIAYVGLNDPWLKKYCVEFIDTPGVNDINEKRSALAEQALVNCDGAIIVTSADKALSASEEWFITERLLKKRTPYLMLAVTKLDRCSSEERDIVMSEAADRFHAVIARAIAGNCSENRKKSLVAYIASQDSAFAKALDDAAEEEREAVIAERMKRQNFAYLFDRIAPDCDNADIVQLKNAYESMEKNVPVIASRDAADSDGMNTDNIGIERIKECIAGWVSSPSRIDLTNRWIAGRAALVLENKLVELRGRRMLAGSDETVSKELIEQKEKQLEGSLSRWEEIRAEMEKRSENCAKLPSEKAADYVKSISERLKYEVSRTPDPKKWWDEDYPYRVRTELTNMSNGVERLAMSRITQDFSWFNSELGKLIRTGLEFDRDREIVNKDVENISVRNDALNVADIKKQRTIGRAITAALSVTATVISYTFLGNAVHIAEMTISGLPIAGSTVLNTGTSLFSEGIYSKNTEKQRDLIKEAIDKNLPGMIDSALIGSRSRVTAAYADLITQAEKKVADWRSAQLMTADAEARNRDVKNLGELDKQISVYERLSDGLSEFLA